jgi:hypothetical protein
VPRQSCGWHAWWFRVSFNLLPQIEHFIIRPLPLSAGRIPNIEQWLLAEALPKEAVSSSIHTHMPGIV